MCPGCGKVWTALQVLWSTVYVICGAAQLISGIFFLISIPTIQLSSNIWTGSWNVIIGIVGGMLACLGSLSPRRQEFILYMAVSILTVNIINVVLTEWGLYFSDMTEVLKNHPNHMLIDYACFATRIATATVIVISFLDSQFAFCSMQIRPSSSNSKINKRKIHGSHEQVSDIEFIIPRAKGSKSNTATVYNAYSQSWVFDADAATSSNNPPAESPYLKILENGGTPKTKCKRLENGSITTADTTHLIDNPVVHVEEASDDSNSNSDRKLCHMRSFSRSASPVPLSGGSSHISLNQTQAPIYDCLETIYRSRLNTGSSNKEGEDESPPQYQAPQTMVLRRVESTSPHAEKVQYASLMKELQRAIVSKKDPNSVTSPQSSEATSASNKTETDSKSSSRQESSRSDCKSSDAEFSKELEAALQLIQDLESPNTIETPSEPIKPIAVWRNSDASESEKTLSAVGSLAEITSPLTECQPELYTFKPPTNGKKGAASVIICHHPDSQSTSGYSSPTHPTPTWSTTSSLNGSNNDIGKPLAYSIHNAKTATVISLYSPQVNPIINQSKGKSITLVNICGDSPIYNINNNINNNNIINKVPPLITATTPTQSAAPIVPEQNKTPTTPLWNVKSLLRKKRQASLPKLCPELEGAIIKSESLAYLSELELLARHQRNKEIQREIEERVIQQLGTPRTESNC